MRAWRGPQESVKSDSWGRIYCRGTLSAFETQCSASSCWLTESHLCLKQPHSRLKKLVSGFFFLPFHKPFDIVLAKGIKSGLWEEVSGKHFRGEQLWWAQPSFSLRSPLLALESRHDLEVEGPPWGHRAPSQMLSKDVKVVSTGGLGAP